MTRVIPFSASTFDGESNGTCQINMKKKKKKIYIVPLTCNAKEDNDYHNNIQGKPYTCEFNERARNPHPHTVSYIFLCV